MNIEKELEDSFISKIKYSCNDEKCERILIEFTSGKIVEYWNFDGNLKSYFNSMGELIEDEDELKRYFYNVIFKELYYKIIKK